MQRLWISNRIRKWVEGHRFLEIAGWKDMYLRLKAVTIRNGCPNEVG